jgi:integrase
MARQAEIVVDIHRYENKFAYAEAQVRRSGLSDRNKALILAYRDACLLKNVCGRVRLIRVMGALTTMGMLVGKDFDQANRQDMERIIAGLITRQPAYSPQTVGTYKAMLRSFMTWITTPDEFPTRHYPPIVAWISCHVRARDIKRLPRGDLITPTDVDKLLAVSRNPRDRALISILWETGARVAEVGNLQLKHVIKHQHGYTLEVTGKTGTRSPLIVESAPYVTMWLSQHPFPDDPQSPVWVHYQYEKTPAYLTYDTISNILRRAFERAEIAKPFHPHIFRHSRATWLLAKGVFTEQQAKTYFGWSPDSDQLSTYAHLVDGDANNALSCATTTSSRQRNPKWTVSRPRAMCAARSIHREQSCACSVGPSRTRIMRSRKHRSSPTTRSRSSSKRSSSGA